MPWFPDFTAAVELARRHAREAGQADPVAQYLTALSEADPRTPGDARPGDVVARYQAALGAGDTEAIVKTFIPNGYFREPIGPHYVHRGMLELRSYFTSCFSAGGGIGLQHCAMTDDGVRCAV